MNDEYFISTASTSSLNGGFALGQLLARHLCSFALLAYFMLDGGKRENEKTAAV